MARVLPHCALLQDVDIAGTQLRWWVGGAVHTPLHAHVCVCVRVMACCNSTFVETHTVGCWWCNLVVCVGCACDIAVTTWRSLCVRGSFAANYHLGTLGVQNIVDALPHARMQRLIIWRAFSSPSPVVVLCRPHAAHPLLLGGVCWCGCTHMQLGACGGGGMFGLLASTMLLCLFVCWAVM